MGEVYRARDTKLDRPVALKILPAAFQLEPDRLARFKREAQVLASINHPNIAAIHGFEDSSDPPALVLELVEGPTLAERLGEGSVPLDEALPIARQICQALEAAHEQGIVHRDLKPANVKVRPDGTVKVLDFGLAKALEPVVPGGSATASPTITSPALTRLGVILGTAAYMSPEQARGRPADKRSDIWAFGCVLYEMLTGRRAFEGEEVSETLASVLKSDPDWSALAAALPAPIRSLVEGCLKKDRQDRIGDVSTVRFLLSQPVAPATPASVLPRARHVWRERAAVLALGTGLSALVFGVWNLRPSPPAEVGRFSIALPEGQQLSLPRVAVAFSPDGRHIAYAASRRIYLRALADLEARAMPGTEDGIAPAFSPDSQSLVFWVGGLLKRISISGGVAVPLCRTGTAPSSITWDDKGILFTLAGSGIMRVSPDGGSPEVLVPLSPSDGLADGARMLPGGDAVLFTLTTDTGVGSGAERWDAARIVVHSLKTGKWQTLLEPGSDARYVPTGHIVYALGETLFARSLDVVNLRLTGGPVPIVDGVRRVLAVDTGSAQFGFSESGSLVYVPGLGVAGGAQQLYRFDRSGAPEPLKLPPGSYNYPRVSPDGNYLAYQTSDGKQSFICVYHLKGGGAAARLTHGGNDRFPIWSGDSKYVVFQSDRDGDPAVFRQPIDGGRAAERLTQPEPGTSHVPEAWSPNQDILLFNVANRESTTSLWMLSVGDRRMTSFGDVKSTRIPTTAVFSPDGKWVAYQASDSRTAEGTVWVQPFPPDGSRFQIAPGGRPLWSNDGKELYFIPGPGRLMVVSVTTQPTFSFSDPTPVPRGFGLSGPLSPRMFDMTPDGRIIGGAVPSNNPTGSVDPANELRVVLNWHEELKAGTFRR